MMGTRENETVDKILEGVAGQMQPMVLRTDPNFKRWTGVGGRRMANLDCLGLGPKEKVLLGRQVAYPRDALLAWIANRLRAA
jgi:hypothetical protein